MIERSYFAAKGGQGVTTVAVADAATCDYNGRTVWLVAHDLDEACAVSAVSPSNIRNGIASPAGPRYATAIMTPDAFARLARRPGAARWPGPDVVIHDLGVAPQPDKCHGQRLLVTRACWLALRQAERLGLRPDGVVLIEEPDRSLDHRDVAAAIGAPVVTRIPVMPEVARAVDAGLLGRTPPRALRRILEGRPLERDAHELTR